VAKPCTLFSHWPVFDFGCQREITASAVIFLLSLFELGKLEFDGDVINKGIMSIQLILLYFIGWLAGG
jgi:hypothetical protein